MQNETKTSIHNTNSHTEPSKVPISRWRSPKAIPLVAFVITFAAIGTYLLTSSHAASPIVGSITDFTNPNYYTSLVSKSFWDQPARGWMNTVPATSMLKAVNINFSNGGDLNSLGAETQVDHLLADSGVKGVRVVKTWASINYANQNQLNPDALLSFQKELTAMKANNLRPLIILQAYDTSPDPSIVVKGTYTHAPKVGDTTVYVDLATAGQIIPGRSGIDTIGHHAKMMDVIFTAVNKTTGAVTLSKPIPTGANLNGKITISAYAPFQKPFLADGKTPNPSFTNTMSGWVSYVKTVCSTAKSILGNDNFDLELWNELISNHAFLSTDAYYSNSPDQGDTGFVQDQILSQTGAYVANPANGLPDVQITDGFANQVPWPGASSLPNGITALSKHQYTQDQRNYPADESTSEGSFYNALGIKDSYAPNLITHFPEVYLSGAYPWENSMIKDLSPITRYTGNTAHGTQALNSIGQTKQVWETEWNTTIQSDPQGLKSIPPQPGEVQGQNKEYFAANDVYYIEAKSDIRYLSSMVNKGLSKVYFYAATPGGGATGIDSKGFQSPLRLVGANFINAVQSNPNVYPGDAAGGEVMQVLQRYTHAFSGAQPITKPQSLSLQRLDDYSGNLQFKGDGTTAHPNVYNRDVFGFFPYQVTNSSFLIPIYVQTEDVEKVYNSSATDLTKYDLPAETYQLTIGGVDGNNVSSVSYSDPLTQATPSVTIVSRSDDSIVIQAPVTDSPRFLAINMCTTNCGSGSGGSGNHQIKPPTISILTPANGETVSGNKVPITSAATTDPTTSVASVTYILDGNNRISIGTLNIAPFTDQWPSNKVPNGPHTLKATVQDATGAVASTQISINVSNNNGIALPTIKVTTLSNKQNVSGVKVLQASTTVDPSTKIKAVQYLLDGKPLSPMITTSPYSYSWDTSKTTVGAHELDAVVQDALGNTGDQKVDITVK